jgi:hypothetical protein
MSAAFIRKLSNCDSVTLFFVTASSPLATVYEQTGQEDVRAVGFVFELELKQLPGFGDLPCLRSSRARWNLTMDDDYTAGGE